MTTATATAAPAPATVTDRELRVLRFAPKLDDLTSPVLGGGYSAEIDALAERGLLRIRGRHFWGVDYQITLAGLSAVWDNAPASLAHLRPAGV